MVKRKGSSEVRENSHHVGIMCYICIYLLKILFLFNASPAGEVCAAARADIVGLVGHEVRQRCRNCDGSEVLDVLQIKIR